MEIGTTQLCKVCFILQTSFKTPANSCFEIRLWTASLIFMVLSFSELHYSQFWFHRWRLMWCSSRPRDLFLWAWPEIKVSIWIESHILFSLLQIFSTRSGVLVANLTYLAFLENFLEFVLRFCGFESDGEMLHLRFLLRIVHGIPTKRRFRTEKQQINLLKETSIMCIKGFFNTSNKTSTKIIEKQYKFIIFA